MDEISHRRRSIRLRGYDYSQEGTYFVTLCTQNREHLFGEIVEGKMELNASGKNVADCWQQIPCHFPDAELDEWVVMPNHVHGIVVVAGTNTVGVKNFSPLQNSPQCPHQHPTGTSRTIGSIVRGFKIGVTKWYRQQSIDSIIWQRNYWEHIVRNEIEMDSIRHYIVNNPEKWETYQLNHLMVGPDEDHQDDGGW